MNAAPADGGYLISEHHHHAIERAERAAGLLSSIDADTAKRAAVEAHHMAAIADYIRGDLTQLLQGAVYIRPAALTRCGGIADPDTLDPGN